MDEMYATADALASELVSGVAVGPRVETRRARGNATAI